MKNQTEKRSTRFNFIDAVIILAVLLVIAAIVWIILLQNGTVGADETADIKYTVKISSVREEFVSAVKEGDEAVNSSTGAAIGKITGVKTEKAKYINADSAVKGEDGTYTASVAEYPDTYDVYVTVSVTAKVSANGVLYVDGNKILIGSPLYFRDGAFAAKGFITGFEKVGD
ncbi:MAG: DUF4330 domain-containing protein [Clostridia bacterium]|nr:DUF4330 domain-containing protein [Clostridia bacterium]MBO4428567.1 DUF4330 domain-containing protein [Clostridia bacterium]